MSKPKVAFICVYNSCRSQMAEAISKVYDSKIFDAYSAGVEITREINPDAVDTIYELYGVNMEKSQKPKPLTELPDIDIVVTMGCGVECPYLPCKHHEDWGINDPSGKPYDEYMRTARIIEDKIRDLADRIVNKKNIF